VIVVLRLRREGAVPGTFGFPGRRSGASPVRTGTGE
jgi:hypothetical protein